MEQRDQLEDGTLSLLSANGSIGDVDGEVEFVSEVFEFLCEVHNKALRLSSQVIELISEFLGEALVNHNNNSWNPTADRR